MFMVSVDSDKCVGCAACVDACPAKILDMVEDKCEVTGDAVECLGCETCVEICPNECFKVMEL